MDKVLVKTENEVEVEEREVAEHLPLNVERKLIRLNRFNPRTKYDREDLSDLIPSISVEGVRDPLLVRPIPEDDEGHIYETVDGDRRLRTAQELKIARVDVWVKEMSDMEALKMGTIYNAFRRNIGPVELGRAYSELWKSEEYSMMNLEKFAHKMGRTKSQMSRLMALPDGLLPEVQDIVAPEGKNRRIPEGSIDGKTAYFLTRIPKGERQQEVSDAIALSPKLRGDKVEKVVEEVKRHPETPAKAIVDGFIAKEAQERKPTITLSSSDYEKIKSGRKTTVIVRGSVQPGLKADVEVAPLIRSDSLKVSDIYKRTLSRFKDRDAERDGYTNLDELKSAWIERYGEWEEEEVVNIIQFAKEA